MRKLVSAAVVAVAGLLWGQTETISFGAAELRLGMSKEQAKTNVCAVYPESCEQTMQFMWQDDFVVVLDRTAHRGVGKLDFKDGRLVRISRLWTPRGSRDATALVKAFYSLVLNANQKGQTLATVTTRTVRTPAMTGDIVVISFGSNGIAIHTEDGEISGTPISGAELSEEYTLDSTPAFPTPRNARGK